MAKISIIVPFYNNRREDITDCIKSVISQGCEDIEIIIVDDGSDCEHAGILEDLRDLSTSVSVITQKNAGPSAARNQGVSQSHGEFITFLDADDMLLPGSLEKMLKEAESGADYIIGGVTALSPDQWAAEAGQRTPESIKRWDITDEDGKKKVKRILLSLSPENDFKGGYIGRGPVSRLVKRSLAIDDPFNESIVIGEDIIWNLGLLEKSRGIRVCFDAWYYYRDNRQSLTRKTDEKVINKLDLQMKELIKLVDLEDDGEYKAFVDHIYENIYIVWDNCLGVKDHTLDKQDKRSIKRMIYNEAPWNMAGEKRYYRLSGRNKKIAWMAYRSKMIFAFCRIR